MRRKLYLAQDKTNDRIYKMVGFKEFISDLKNQFRLPRYLSKKGITQEAMTDDQRFAARRHDGVRTEVLENNMTQPVIYWHNCRFLLQNGFHWIVK
jgi:hypothetical protein